MKPSPEALEKAVHQALRSLPERRAPHSLESRVLAAIAARQELPWWKQSFAQWPLAARAAFLLLSVALVSGLVFAWMNAGVSLERPNLTATFSHEVAFLENLRASLRALGELGAAALRNIPTVWVYAGLGCIAALYATVLGVGATAYRTLYASR